MDGALSALGSHRRRKWFGGFFGEAGGESIETARVLLAAVLFESGISLLFRPAVQRLPLAHVLQERDTVTAGGLHQVDIDAHELPCAQRLLVVKGGTQWGGVVAAVRGA